MKPVRIIAIHEAAAATPPAARPPMTPKQVEDAARAFVAYRRNVGIRARAIAAAQRCAVQ